MVIGIICLASFFLRLESIFYIFSLKHFPGERTGATPAKNARRALSLSYHTLISRHVLYAKPIKSF